MRSAIAVSAAVGFLAVTGGAAASAANSAPSAVKVWGADTAAPKSCMPTKTSPANVEGSATPAAVTSQPTTPTRHGRGTFKRLDPRPAQTPAGQPATAPVGDHTVGILYSENSKNTCFYCTASVVTSPKNKSIIATAAHCIYDPPKEASAGWHHSAYFVPGYQKGKAFPYGQFKVYSASVEPEWTVNGSPNADVAFLAVGPNAKKQQVSKIVGENGFEVNAPVIEHRTIFGYQDKLSFLSRCFGETHLFAPGINVIRMDDCLSTAGSSGGPWFDRYNGKFGLVNGVTEAGFADTRKSFSTYFDDTTWDTYFRLHA